MFVDTYLLGLRDAFKDGDSEKFDSILDKRQQFLEEGIDEVLGSGETEVVEPVS